MAELLLSQAASGAQLWPPAQGIRPRHRALPWGGLHILVPSCSLPYRLLPNSNCQIYFSSPRNNVNCSLQVPISMFHKIFTTKVMEKDPCIGSNLDKLECPLPAHEGRCCEAPVLFAGQLKTPCGKWSGKRNRLHSCRTGRGKGDPTRSCVRP